MSVIIIGDVGVKGSYHLGDEAMTEYAIDALRARGASSLTVVAGSPAVAKKRFGTEAIPRLGFKDMTSRERNARLDAITRCVTKGEATLKPDDPAHEVIAALRRAKAFVIAGGGNLSSDFLNHVYERLALARIARHFELPVLISSQTFGPLLAAGDQPLLDELLSHAVAVGARESYSYAFALERGVPAERAVHMLDDAAWLEPTDADERFVASLSLPSRFVVASFTHHKGQMLLSTGGYYEALAQTLDRTAIDLDLDVVLVPHVGSFEPDAPSGDQLGNKEIVKHSKSGRLRAMPLLTARQAIALTRKAALSLSTRYHPAVFGPSNAIPSMTITTSYYSSVRMFGALSNVGLGDLAIPSEVWTPELIRDAAGECVRNRDDIRAHLRKVVAQARSQSERWWNAIANTALRGRAWEPVESIEAAAPYAFTGSWVAHPRIARPVADHHLRERVIEKRAYSAELKRLQGIVERSRKGLTAAAVELGLVVTPTPLAEGAPSSSN